MSSAASRQAAGLRPTVVADPLHDDQDGQGRLCGARVASSERVDVSHFPQSKYSSRVIRLRATSRHHSRRISHQASQPAIYPTRALLWLAAMRYICSEIASLDAPGRTTLCSKSAPCQMRSMFGDVRNPGIRLPLADETT